MDSLYFERGLSLFSEKRFEESQAAFISSYRAHENEYRQALFYFLHVCEQKMDYQAAIDLLEEVIQHHHTDHAWYSIMSDMWAKLGEISKAIAYAEQSLLLEPHQESTSLNLASWKASQISDGLEIKKLFEDWAQKFIVPIESRQIQSDRNIDLNPDRILKIGYISGDLKNHSIRYFIESYFKLHDREKFQIHAFMTMEEDEISAFLKPTVDAWHNVKDLTDTKLHAFIQNIGIDILVDLSGHTLGNRLKVFAMRAAPIQMTWFGDMHTLGIKSVDYRITDFSMCPPGTDAHYTEKLLRFDCMSSYLPPLNSEKQYPSPYKTNGHVTMVSLNNSRKLSDLTLQTWSEILQENPRSGLIIVSAERTTEGAHQSLIPRLEKINAPMQQIAISARLTMQEFMHMASVADFALDPFPISGGTTTYHSLWMGLPILTLHAQGGMAVSTATPMTMLGIGMECCVANGLDAYKSKAKLWIDNPEMIDAMRLVTRSNFAQCALLDYPTRTRELETAYRDVWGNYVASQELKRTDHIN